MRGVTSVLPESRRPLTQRYCRDLWYSVARMRQQCGDAEGAARARAAARLIGQDTRVRHDLGWRSPGPPPTWG